MNIYVGNLSRDLTESDLREAFQAFGEVTTVSIIKDKFSNESRGFGFVEMPNPAEAKAVIAGLERQEPEGPDDHRQRSPPPHGKPRRRRRRFRRRPPVLTRRSVL